MKSAEYVLAVSCIDICNYFAIDFYLYLMTVLDELDELGDLYLNFHRVGLMVVHRDER